MHINTNNRDKSEARAKLINSMLTELNLSNDFKEEILPLVNQEMALSYVGQDEDEVKFLFLRTKKMQEVVNLVVAENLAYKIVSSRLLVLAQEDFKYDFLYNKNDLFMNMNQVKFAGRELFWGFINKKVFFNSFLSSGEFISSPSELSFNNANKNFIFIGQGDNGRMRLRIGELRDVSDNNSSATVLDSSQVEKLNPIHPEFNSDTNLVIILDNMTSLEKYIEIEELNKLGQTFLEKYRVNLNDFSRYAAGRAQFSLTERENKKYFQIIVPVEGPVGQQEADYLENILKTVVAFHFAREEKIILPDKTTARQLVAGAPGLVRQEKNVNGEKVVVLRLDDKNFELAFSFAQKKLFISNKGSLIESSLSSLEGNVNLKNELGQCFIPSGENLLYLHESKYFSKMPLPISKMGYSNLLMVSADKRFFSGFEACLY